MRTISTKETPVVTPDGNLPSPTRNLQENPLTLRPNSLDVSFIFMCGEKILPAHYRNPNTKPPKCITKK